MSPLVKPCAVEVATAGFALLMDETVLAASSVVPREKITPLGSVTAMMVP